MCQNVKVLSFCHSEELATKNLLSYVCREEILHCVQNDRMIGFLHFDTSFILYFIGLCQMESALNTLTKSFLIGLSFLMAFVKGT